MPLYAYECESCGVRFDVRQSFNDASLTVCPECEGKVHRIIQPVGVVFKGSGFYVTDSKGKQSIATSGTRKDEADSSDSSDRSDKTEKADTKSESTKSESTSTAASTTSSTS